MRVCVHHAVHCSRIVGMIEGHHDTLANAAAQNSDIPALPSTWMAFNEYNDYRAKSLLLYFIPAV